MVVEGTQKSRPVEVDQVDLLFRYYDILKQDLLSQTGNIKNHVRNSQIIGGAFIAIFTFLINFDESKVSSNTVIAWLAGTVTFTTVTYYLIYDVLEATFAVRALEECLSFLEDRVNEDLGVNRLVWQSGVAQRLWPNSPTDLGFIPPMKVLWFYEALLILGATVILPSYVYYKAWFVLPHDSVIRNWVAGFEFYSLLSAAVIISVTRGVNGDFFRDKIREMTAKKWAQVLPKKSGSEIAGR